MLTAYEDRPHTSSVHSMRDSTVAKMVSGTDTSETSITHAPRMKVRHGEADLLVWVEAPRRREHLRALNQLPIPQNQLATHLDARRLERVLGGEQQLPMILSARVRRVRRSALHRTIQHPILSISSAVLTMIKFPANEWARQSDNQAAGHALAQVRMLRSSGTAQT